MKKCRLMILAFGILILAIGCNAKNEINEKEDETMNTTEITINELTIPNGEHSIYGKLYIPTQNGTHPAIILSHGYNGTHNDFAKECKYYAEHGYIAYAFDFCGGSNNSKSSGSSTDMTIFTETSDLLAVFDYLSAMDDVDKEQLFLFGGSQGGLVTTLVAEQIADKVKGMVLYYPALCIPDDWRNTYPTTEDIPDTLNFWGLNLGKNFFTAIHDYYVFDHIGSFDKDILIIHGDKDNVVSIDYSQKAVVTYENATLITLPGEGHGFSQSGGITAMQEVLTYLKEHTNQ
ncbi:alpha/beta hydrolase family protein [Anaerosporobacter sp.]|uniref:alpha/beta hydrolase family protein n=1 Tax=Anaerosporobacter sp. TaxID=1872529 RepID=UPI00286EF978|nr:alpha/beta fold hydrolase [Anaerosporobacter sp.]